MNIGKSIAQIRKSRGLSQEQFGRMFHVTRQTISNWENEKSYPDLNTLTKISDTFNISLDELIRENPQMVRKIDKERKFSKTGKIIIAILLILVILMGIFLKILSDAFRPTDEGERNVSNTDVMMYLNLPNANPSRAIVRTYNREAYEALSENERKNVEDCVDGRMEGDIPPLIFPGPQRIYFTFQDIAHNDLTPDRAPAVKLTEHIPLGILYGSDGHIRDGRGTEPREKTAVLSRDKTGYYIEFDNPFTQEALENGDDVIFCLIEVSYTINGQDYVSISAFNKISETAGFPDRS